MLPVASLSLWIAIYILKPYAPFYQLDLIHRDVLIKSDRLHLRSMYTLAFPRPCLWRGKAIPQLRTKEVALYDA